MTGTIKANVALSVPPTLTSGPAHVCLSTPPPEAHGPQQVAHEGMWPSDGNKNVLHPHSCDFSTSVAYNLGEDSWKHIWLAI